MAKWRPLVRTLHRDAGYLAVGLTFVYAASGIAVNHVAEWDPNFRNFQTTHELGGPLAGSDDEVATKVRAQLAIKDEPREVYREGESQLDVLFDRRTLHVNTATGHVVDEGQKPRGLLRLANWLHLNRGKKAWTYVADTYAAGLLFLAVSGMVMLPGRKGFLGRGAVLVAVGAAAPILYVVFSGGPG